MKTNLFKLMATLFVAALSFGFTSCGGDDDDSGNGGGTSSDPEGTITVNMRNDYNDYTWFQGGSLEITNSNNFTCGGNYYYNDNGKVFQRKTSIVCVGKVKGIGSITRIPKNGWNSECLVQPGYGYIYHVKETLNSSSTTLYFVRIYVVDYMKDISGGIIGATIKYQEYNDWKEIPDINI